MTRFIAGLAVAAAVRATCSAVCPGSLTEGDAVTEETCVLQTTERVVQPPSTSVERDRVLEIHGLEEQAPVGIWNSDSCPSAVVHLWATSAAMEPLAAAVSKHFQ